MIPVRLSPSKLAAGHSSRRARSEKRRGLVWGTHLTEPNLLNISHAYLLTPGSHSNRLSYGSRQPLHPIPLKVIRMSLTRESLLRSPTRNGVPSSEDAFTAQDLLQAQSALEVEAAEVIPFSSSLCTYDQGPIRQAVYACRTCLGEPSSGICAACSVSCHAEHDLVELFVRRQFTCDCGTERMGAGSCCSLREIDGEDMERNEGNRYDSNFYGQFCWCEKGKNYDPQTET